MEPRINLITIGVADLERAIEFYHVGLGWPMRYTPGEGVAFFQLGPIVLSLFPLTELAKDAHLPVGAGGFGGISLAQNVDSPAEVDSVLAAAVQAGATLLKPGQHVFWGGYSGYFADPDGYLWEVAHNPFFPRDANGMIVLPQP